MHVSVRNSICVLDLIKRLRSPARSESVQKVSPHQFGKFFQEPIQLVSDRKSSSPPLFSHFLLEVCKKNAPILFARAVNRPMTGRKFIKRKKIILAGKPICEWGEIDGFWRRIWIFILCVRDERALITGTNKPVRKPRKGAKIKLARKSIN